MTPQAKEVIAEVEEACKKAYGRVIPERVMETLANLYLRALRNGSPGYDRLKPAQPKPADSKTIKAHRSKY